MNDATIFDKLGGRKFLLSLVILIAIIALSLSGHPPSTETVVGLLGVLATYSGSNSFLTAFVTKNNGTPAAAAVEEPGEVEMAPAPEMPKQEATPEAPSDLEQRLNLIEQTQQSIIQVLKNQGELILKLTTGPTSSKMNPEGVNNNGANTNPAASEFLSAYERQNY